MATASDVPGESENEFAYRLLKTLRGSLLLSFIAIGIGLVLLAAVFDHFETVTTLLGYPMTITSQDGIIAGMFGVFGISSIAAAGGFYLLLRWHASD